MAIVFFMGNHILELNIWNISISQSQFTTAKYFVDLSPIRLM